MIKIYLVALSLILATACTTASKPVEEKVSPEEAAIRAKCKDCPPDKHMSIVIANGTTARFFVRAFLNDQPKKFLIDTGAVRSSIILNEETKTLKSTGTSRFGGISLVPQVCDWVKVDSFKVSGWHYPQAPFSRCEDRGSGDVLGLDYMKHVLSLDFEHAVFSLKGPAPKDVKLKELKRNKFGMPEIPIKIAGKDDWALFDTGAGMTVIDQAIVDANPKAFAPFKVDVDGEQKQVESPFKDSTGKMVSGKAYMASEIDIEGVPKTAQLITAIPFTKELKEKLHAPIILGANSIMTANWFLDFTTNQWAAYAFSPKMPKLSGIQVDSGNLVREDDNKMTVSGEAKISNDDNWLTGPLITIDLRLKRAYCEKDCVLAQGESRTYLAPIVVDIGDKDWLTVDVSQSDTGVNGVK